MLVYTANKATFVEHVRQNQIEERILEAFLSRLKRKVSNPPPGACYSYQPEIQLQATNLRGRSRRDFTHEPDRLLSELERPIRPVFKLTPA